MQESTKKPFSKRNAATFKWLLNSGLQHYRELKKDIASYERRVYVVSVVSYLAVIGCLCFFYLTTSFYLPLAVNLLLPFLLLDSGVCERHLALLLSKRKMVSTLVIFTNKRLENNDISEQDLQNVLTVHSYINSQDIVHAIEPDAKNHR